MINGTQLVTPLSLCPFCNSELGGRGREEGRERGCVCVLDEAKTLPKKLGNVILKKREPLATCVSMYKSSNLT